MKIPEIIIEKNRKFKFIKEYKKFCLYERIADTKEGRYKECFSKFYITFYNAGIIDIYNSKSN